MWLCVVLALPVAVDKLAVILVSQLKFLLKKYFLFYVESI